MLTLRGRPEGSAGATGEPRRAAGATAVSVVAHAVLLVLFWQALQMPVTVRQFFFTRAPTVETPRERVRFVQAPEVDDRRVSPPAVVPSAAEDRGGAVRAGRAQGAEAPDASAPSRAAPLVAPTEVPTGIPAPGTTGTAEAIGPASGPLASGRGAVKGLQPGYVDPRLWVAAPEIEYAPKTDEERLDSAVVGTITKYRDSVMANTYAPNKFERGDWTYRTKGGDRYGVDRQFIRLGKFSIPTALLGLLPMNQMQGNPIENDRQARLAAMRVDIMQGAQAAMNEEEFRRAVKAIRARKDKERRAQEKQKKAEQRTISNR